MKLTFESVILKENPRFKFVFQYFSNTYLNTYILTYFETFCLAIR